MEEPSPEDEWNLKFGIDAEKQVYIMSKNQG